MTAPDSATSATPTLACAVLALLLASAAFPVAAYQCRQNVCVCTGDADCNNLVASGDCTEGTFERGTRGGFCEQALLAVDGFRLLSATEAMSNVFWALLEDNGCGAGTSIDYTADATSTDVAVVAQGLLASKLVQLDFTIRYNVAPAILDGLVTVATEQFRIEGSSSSARDRRILTMDGALAPVGTPTRIPLVWRANQQLAGTGGAGTTRGTDVLSRGGVPGSSAQTGRSFLYECSGDGQCGAWRQLAVRRSDPGAPTFDPGNACTMLWFDTGARVGAGAASTAGQLRLFPAQP